MEYYVQAPMRYNKYQNSKYSYRDTFAFPSNTYINSEEQRIVTPDTATEFQTFTMRENATQMVFFANSKDPMMATITKLLAPFATNINKLVVIDVDKIPELGSHYEIPCPTLYKIYKGRVVRCFTQKFTSECLQKFASMPSTVRWRQPNMR
jgi:hypothetical protein